MPTTEQLEAQINVVEQQLVVLDSDISSLNLLIAKAIADKDQLETEIANRTNEHDTKVTQQTELSTELAALKEELANVPKLSPVGASMGQWNPKDVNQRRQDVVDMLDAGLTWLRAGVNWSGSQKEVGKIQTIQSETIAQITMSLGMHWLDLMAYTPPAFSTAPPGLPPYKADKYPPKPEYYDEWELWVKTQARAIYNVGKQMGLSDDRIAELVAFEIWNEQNSEEFFGWPDPKIYVTLLKRAHRAIKSVCKKFRVIFGGMAPHPDRVGDKAKGITPSYRSSTFVKRCFDAGMTAADFDAMNFHPYNGQVSLSATAGKDWDMNTTIYEEVLDVMTAHGCGAKQMWCTEFGYGTANCKNPVSEADQGKLLVDQIKFLRSRPTAGPVFIFSWLEWPPAGLGFSNYGVVRVDRRKKPAVSAIRSYLQANP